MSRQLVLHGLQSHRSADVVVVVWDAVVGDLHEVTRDVPPIGILEGLYGVEDVLSTKQSTAWMSVCVFCVKLCPHA